MWDMFLPVCLFLLDLTFFWTGLNKENMLGKKLRALREVGNVIDLDGAFISNVETNKKPLNRKYLSTLSKFFNVQEQELQTL